MAQQSESRALDKVIVRLPDGMRDRIKDAADANNRSMNAEIVARLDFHDELVRRAADLAAQTSQLTGELEATKTELAEANKRTQPAGQSDLWNSMLDLMQQVRERQKKDDRALAEVQEIDIYLQGDTVCLNANLNNEIWKPSAIRPLLETSLARNLAASIDQRSWALAKTIKKTARDAREHEAPSMLARHLRHRLLSDDLTDQILETFLKEVDGLATPLHAADFYDKVSDMINAAPEDARPAYKATLDAVMPKLFKGWPDDWY